MAQFQAAIHTPRSVTTRLGHRPQGVSVRIQGNRRGYYITASHEDGIDTFRLYETGGRWDESRGRLLAMYTADGSPVLRQEEQDAPAPTPIQGACQPCA